MGQLHYRESIVDYLEAMANMDKQDSLGPIEAFNVWFNDLYVPCDDPQLYNPGVYEKGLKDFKSCFSEEELQALSQFHKYIASIVDDFSIDRAWFEIQRDPQWQQLTSEAKEALNVFRNPKGT